MIETYNVCLMEFENLFSLFKLRLLDLFRITACYFAAHKVNKNLKYTTYQC